MIIKCLSSLERDSDYDREYPFDDMRRERLHGFTLLELLVVVSVVALLVSILLSSLGTARETAKRVMCANNLAQIGRATHAYAADRNDALPLSRALDSNWEDYSHSPWSNGYRHYGQLVGLNLLTPDAKVFWSPCKTGKYSYTGILGYANWGLPGKVVTSSYMMRSPRNDPLAPDRRLLDPWPQGLAHL